MALNPYIGWGISSLALYFLNKGAKSGNDSSSLEPNDLNVTQTKIGTPIPVILGTSLIKSPLTIYYGDFRAQAYTETYAAHAKFNAWPLVFALIAQYISAPATTTGTGSGPVVGGGGGQANVKILGKDMAVGPLINALFMWLLSWLINGRNLKTTMQKGFKYYLGYQQLLCWSGPNAKLKKIYMNENLVWEGSIGAKEQNGAAFVVPINNDQLFGGPDENGGFVGEIHVYFGGDTQMPDNWMVKQMKADSVQESLRGLTPAYRPFISVVVPTAYVGKQATIPAMWYEIENIPNALGLKALDGDVNPAEVFYEMHVNKDWGLAEAEDLLNLKALKEIGKTLQEEKIGITVPLTSKITAGQLIDSICEHINAVKFIEPKDGKLTYRLIRSEKDLTNIPILNESNISKISFSRLDWRETISEISASYTDRSALYETGSLSDTDPANVEINNGIVTTKTYSFPYFFKAENALWAAKRELMQQGYPLAAVSIEGNRNLYLLRLGDIFCLNFPAYGIKNMLLRVTDVNLGNFTEGVVKIEALEDIFSLAKTDFDFSNSTEWKPAPLYPTGAQTFSYFELPYEMMRIKDSYVYAFAVQPDTKTQTWTIWRKRTGGKFETTNTMSKWTAAGRLIYDYDAFTDAEDLVGIELIDLGGLEDLRFTALNNAATDIVSARRAGKILLMGNELMAWSNLVQLPNGNWRVEGLIRGVYDTVPAKHGNGEIIYFIESGHYANVTTGGPVCHEGNTVDEFYNITTGTVDGQEDFDDSKVKRLTTVRRAECPSPPGRIRMSAHLLYEQVNAGKIAGTLSIQWTARNKQLSFGCVSQDDEKEYWSNANFSPPEGLTYIFNVYANGKLLKQYNTINTVFTYSWAQRVLDGGNLAATIGETTIEIYAKVKDLLSYQAQKRTFVWTIPTMVNTAMGELAVLSCIGAWGDSLEIVVPKNLTSEVQRVKYTDLPVIILGQKVLAAASNTIVGYNGSYIIPDGRIALIKSANDYELVTLEIGFVVKTKYKEPGETAQKYIQWNGTQFVEFI